MSSLSAYIVIFWDSKEQSLESFPRLFLFSNSTYTLLRRVLDRDAQETRTNAKLLEQTGLEPAPGEPDLVSELGSDEAIGENL